MWYLVVPPIIVVLSLFFLLWYLSRKGEDPTVAERVREESEKHSVFFLRMKEFFLRQIEKIAQRFKVNLLRAHNSLNEFTQSVKSKRTKMRPVETMPESEAEEGSVAVEEKKGGRFFSFKKEVAQTPQVTLSGADEELLHTEIVRKGKRFHQTEEVQKEKVELPERPMVSETVAEPESRKRMVRENGDREEGLIARIAKDPKDFTAYEALGDYYLEAGNIKDAKECYRQVLKLSPVHRMVKIKIRRLEKLLTRGGE